MVAQVGAHIWQETPKQLGHGLPVPRKHTGQAEDGNRQHREQSQAARDAKHHWGATGESELEDYHPPTDIRTGEALLAEVYNAVRASPAWEKTALLVLFDEGGGCYDHVGPPAAAPDGYTSREGFDFDRFGIRVPSIMISAYTERDTVISDEFHHTSFLRSMRERFDLGHALTPRDASAPLLTPAFNRNEPRVDAFRRMEPPSLDGVDKTRGGGPRRQSRSHAPQGQGLRARQQQGLVPRRRCPRQPGEADRRSKEEVPREYAAMTMWAADRTKELHEGS